MTRPTSLSVCATLGLLAAIAAAPAAHAQVFTVGNNFTNTSFTDFPGQSFSPAVLGNAGTGIAPASGPVALVNFSIGYVNSVNAGTLYLFDRQYTGTPNGLPALTVGGAEGLLGVSSSVTASTFSFGSGLTLPDVNAAYFAYSSVEAQYFTDETNGTAYGGTTLQAFFAPGGGSSQFWGTSTFDEDIVFSAELHPVPAPATLVTALAGVVPGLCVLMRRRSRKRV